LSLSCHNKDLLERSGVVVMLSIIHCD